jgi:ADP-heptose:LPS heptosyltransferase
VGVPLPSPIRKIAVFRALYLGDFICATPALRALRDRFPQAEITLIGLPWTEELLHRLALVDRLELFPGFPGLPEAPFDAARTDQFLDRMRAERFDLVLQLHGDGSISNDFVAALEGRHSLGYSHAGTKNKRLSHTLPWRADDHEVHRWLRLVRVLGADADDRIDFPVTLQDRDEATRLLAPGRRQGGPLVGLHCGAKLPSRRWPIDRFAQLARTLTDEAGAAIVLTGSAAERPLTAELRSRLDRPALDLTGKTDLGALGAVIAQLDLVVTNDTGVSHVAAATGTRSVVLFGPSDPAVWAPLDSRRHRVIDAASARQRSDTALLDLDAGVVLEACLGMLNRCGHGQHRPCGAELTCLVDA